MWLMNQADKKKLDELIKTLTKDRKVCVLDDQEKCVHCGECFICDIDPDKLCDNCGKCVDEFKTDEKGYVDIKIDKIDSTGADVHEFYKLAGLDDEDDDDCDCDDCNCHHNHND